MHHPYFDRYIALTPIGNLTELIRENTELVATTFSETPVLLHNYSYADGKWTIKQMLQHINDAERVFAYRALVCARGDTSPMNPFDENAYALVADGSDRTMTSLINEFVSIRTSTIFLFDSLPECALDSVGHLGAHKLTARIQGSILVGHAIHHLNILKERYL